MIALPFIYFCIWLFMSYKRCGIAPATYMIFLYTVTSLFAIILDANNYYANNSCVKMDLGIIAPMLYCAVLTFCIQPFYSIKFPPIKKLSYKQERKLKYLVYFYFIIFLIVLIVSYSRIDVVLTSDLAAIRYERYSRTAQSFYNHLSGFPRYVCAICSMLSASCYAMILVFIYLLIFSNKPLLFKIMALCGSFTPLLIAINIADRSCYVYWLLAYGLAYTIFKPYINKKTKQVLSILMLVVLSAIGTYIALVTISRFGARTGGTSGGLVLYLGQNYINFCNFVNYLNPGDSLIMHFPFILHEIFGQPGYFDVAHKVEAISIPHQPICNFSTFVGLVYSISGLFFTLIYLLVYRILTQFYLSKINRTIISLDKMFIYWAMALLPVLGVFGSFYINSGSSIALIVWLFLGFFIG